MKATDAIRAALRSAEQFSLALADDMNDAPLTFPTPTGGNHPMWVIGHVAYSEGSLLAMLTGQANPYEHWKALFAGGTEPTSDSAAYPPFAEVLDALRDIRRRTLQLLDETGDAGLDKPVPQLPPRLVDNEQFSSIGRLFLFIAMHQLLHHGQLSDARRAASRKPFR